MIILTDVNKNNICSVDDEKIINLVIKYRNFIFHDYDNYDDYCEYEKFKDYYTGYYYSFDILLNIDYFNYSGKLHREDGPAWISYYKNGEIDIEDYYLNDKIYSYEDYILEIKKLV